MFEECCHGKPPDGKITPWPSIRRIVSAFLGLNNVAGVCVCAVRPVFSSLVSECQSLCVWVCVEGSLSFNKGRVNEAPPTQSRVLSLKLVAKDGQQAVAWTHNAGSE